MDKINISWLQAHIKNISCEFSFKITCITRPYYHFVLFRLTASNLNPPPHCKAMGLSSRLTRNFQGNAAFWAHFYEMTQTSKTEVSGVRCSLEQPAPRHKHVRACRASLYTRARLFYNAAMWKIAAFAPRRTAHKANICSRTQFQPRFRYHSHAVTQPAGPRLCIFHQRARELLSTPHSAAGAFHLAPVLRFNRDPPLVHNESQVKQICLAWERWPY